MAIDAGPATGSGVQTFGLPGGPVVTGIEIHVGNPPSALLGDFATGVNPLAPVDAPFIDPTQAGTDVRGNALTPFNSRIVFSAPNVSQRIVNPA